MTCNSVFLSQRLSRGFDTVLIDEACQCSEIAALQPLVYGAEKVLFTVATPVFHFI